MTDQQKKTVEEAAEKKGCEPLYFIRGAEEVLNNPEKYGLVPFEDYIQTVKENKKAQEDFREERKENARLRYALKDIADRALCYPEVLDIARQALKGGEQ